MNLPDLKHLDKIIALCRRRGVSQITIDGVAIVLGDAPESTYKKKQKAAEAAPDTPIETDLLSEEALLFWSSSGETTEGDLQ